tara:strand:+ start:101 stop:487 length:387 start_codon:yes stop_codon:yes gene_type:complete
MAVTTSQIRDLLNRPPNLVEGAITEYINMRTVEADKIARTNTYGIGVDNVVTTANKEEYIKAAVCADVLVILINTLPAHTMPEARQGTDDRFRRQLEQFQLRAAELKALIAEPNAAAFATESTATRQE